MSWPRLTRFVPLLALSLPVAVTVACYGPTEVVVSVSTDLPCSERPRTAIYKGLPFEDAPDAETETCTPVPNGDAEIGSLVFLPTGDADGRAAVKAVLARNRSISECDAHPEDCIVATRSFSFVKHLSRRVPIRMLSACLGKRCPEGQTCGRGGVCISNEVTCATSGCDLENEPPGDDAPSVPDAGGADVVEAGAPVVPGACSGPNGNGVLAEPDGMNGLPAPKHAAFGGGAFYFFEAAPQPRIMRVTTAGGAPVPVYPLPGPDGMLIELATLGSSWIATHARVVGASKVVSVSSSLNGAPGDLNGYEGVKAIAAVADPQGQAVYLARSEVVDKIVFGALPVQFVKAGADRIAVDATAVYLSQPSGLRAVDRNDPTKAQDIPLTPEPTSNAFAFGTDGTAVFAAGLEKGVWKILPLQGFPGVGLAPAIEPGGRGVSLTADATHVYWTDGTVISRDARLSSGGGKVETVYTAEPGEQVGHLAVDSACLYYWSQPPGIVATGVLRVAPKSGKP